MTVPARKHSRSAPSKRQRRGAPAVRRVRRRRRSEKRGVALILVLGALTLLTVMLTEFQDATSAELGNALSQRDSVKAEYAARSAVNLSRLLIAAEPTIRKAMGPIGFLMGPRGLPQIPVWAYADRVLGAFNDKEGNDAFQQLAGVDLADGKNLGLDGAGFEVQIVDEDSKIDLNIAARGDAFSEVRVATELMGLMAGPQYDPMFENRDADGSFSDRQTICGAIIDWADANQDTYTCAPNSATASSAGAEDSFYRLLKQPYERKNAAFDSLEELHRVRGIGDRFWDTFVEPDPDNPDKRTVTVWSQGPVNVNTANAQTLLAVICAYGPSSPVCVDPAEATKFLGAMSMIKDGFLHGIPVFGSPNDFVAAMTNAAGPLGVALKALNMKPFNLNSKNELKKAVTVKSKVFSIYATGHVKSGKRETRTRIHAVVDFRGAPPPGMAQVLQATGGLDNLTNGAASGGGTGGAGATGGTSGTQANPLGIPGSTANAIASVLKPSPAGNIIYYKID